MKNRLITAIMLCQKWHGDQKRKYTNEPYWYHPVEVFEIVKSVEHTDDMLIASLLHDVVEDTKIEIGEIREIFGDDVADLVFMLTNYVTKDSGNRRYRKNIELAKLANSSNEAQTIKLADIISNISSIVERDPEFAKKYVLEKKELLNVLKYGDKSLYKKAKDLVTKSEEQLKSI